MTLKQLNDYARLRRELSQAEKLKASLFEAAEPGAQNLSGMPHAVGFRDKLGELVPAIMDEAAEIEAQIARLREELAQRKAEITVFVDSIPDIQTRTIFRLRFLAGLDWSDVAAAVGGKNNAASVKITCYRYLRKVVP